MEPAFALCVVAPAVNVFFYHVRIVPAEPCDFLLDTNSRVLHKSSVAALPELAMPLDRTRYAVAHGLDHILLYHLARKRREFLVPVHDLRRSISRPKRHGDILPVHERGWNGITSCPDRTSFRIQISRSIRSKCLFNAGLGVMILPL